MRGVETVVMGASFRSTEQSLALAGCDRLTISPKLPKELADSEEAVERKLSSNDVSPVARVELDEERFRWAMNENQMASEMLGAGIRVFAKDLETLPDVVRKRLAWRQCMAETCKDCH